MFVLCVIHVLNKYICTLPSKIAYFKYNCLMYQQFKSRKMNLFDETLWRECTKIEMTCFFSPYWGFQSTLTAVLQK